MDKISKKHQEIIGILLEKESLSSSEIHQTVLKIGEGFSLVTIKRALTEMASSGLLRLEGSGRATRYRLSTVGRIRAEVDAKKYSSIEPDKRYGLSSYNFELLPSFPVEIFSDGELEVLSNATAEYEKRTKDLPPAIQKKELERLVIELSWKSSRIEGNTYTLLDTEKLILENKEAPGHSQKETHMILNHKDAFNFIHENKSYYKTMTRKNLEDLHAFLVKDLSINLGLRSKPVGVTGSIYKPLDNVHQISEAVSELSSTVDRMHTSYAKALVALLGISYIQPFEDGNKRTSRLMANAILLAHSRAPLSYRSVDEDEYREAVFVFYELNSIVPFKKIFISQYDFAAKNYAVK
ncbi:MAG: hypothetical protein UX72_C0040G0006 [Parcubacteria group bacterium GW2011_GWA2_47_10]|nr:MAG: hypothetical protein UX72_C0040G0006 [Parcubacteria group bacterium GW2011_GWA2_47_10]